MFQKHRQSAPSFPQFISRSWNIPMPSGGSKTKNVTVFKRKKRPRQLWGIIQAPVAWFQISCIIRYLPLIRYFWKSSSKPKTTTSQHHEACCLRTNENLEKVIHGFITYLNFSCWIFSNSPYIHPQHSPVMVPTAFRARLNQHLNL